MKTLPDSPTAQSPAPSLSDNKTHQTPSVKGNSSFSYKNHKRNCTFRVYENYVEYSPPKYSYMKTNYVIPKRGLIKSFSKRSRFRLFAVLSKIDRIHDRNVLFITLTYHENYTSSAFKAQTDLHNFLTQLRTFDRGVQYIWRLEYQKRGAPHFHMILFPGASYQKLTRSAYNLTLKSKWHLIADPNSRAHAKYGFDVVEISDYRKACAYLSKYLAKVPDSDADIVRGKQWGCSRDLPMLKYQEVTCRREIAEQIINRIRKWLFSQGKDAYASDEYFNADRPQGVFMHHAFFAGIEGQYDRCDFTGLNFGDP